MLDFHQVIQQIEAVGRDSLVDRVPQEEVLAEAVAAYADACADPQAFAGKLEENSKRVLWPTALPLEPVGQRRYVERYSGAVTVAATDGSQIMPSHHEVYSCYLLNIGIALISYNAKLPPKLYTRPHLYHRPEDLYPLVDRRRVHIDELFVSLERNLLELETLAEVALAARERGLPVVAFLDGSLIPWSVEKMPEGYQKSFVERMEAAGDSLADAGIPLLGYLSHSRSSDVVNDLRVWRCPYERSDCRQLCGHLNEEDFPCSKVWPLADRQLFGASLAYGERSALFASGATVLRTLSARQKTCFLYVNVGHEVARLELPRWLADDRETLDLALAVTLAQVDKGRGYPVCLAEAHNLAVIKGGDRTRFFELIARHLVSLGVDRVRVSPKESRKRRGIV
jgi:hypothetical protein